MEKLTFADRVFLWRDSITKISQISKHVRLFHVEDGNAKFVLKFSYAGNVQYHKVTDDEARKLVSELTQEPQMKP